MGRGWRFSAEKVSVNSRSLMRRERRGSQDRGQIQVPSSEVREKTRRMDTRLHIRALTLTNPIERTIIISATVRGLGTVA